MATGFVLCLVAGAVSTGVPLSSWLLLATAFGSLFMVSGRRYSEMSLREQNRRQARSTLETYSSSYLRFVWSGSAIISIMAYLLWSSQELPRTRPLYTGLATAMFIVAILRYALDVDRRSAGAPEDIAFSDRVLQALALLGLVATTVAVYA